MDAAAGGRPLAAAPATLDVLWVVQNFTANLDGVPRTALGVNGTTPGPPLEVFVGDTVVRGRRLRTSAHGAGGVNLPPETAPQSGQILTCGTTLSPADRSFASGTKPPCPLQFTGTAYTSGERRGCDTPRGSATSLGAQRYTIR